jgi:hypothetical protein
MSVIRNNVDKGIYINVRDGYYKVLVLEKCITYQKDAICNIINNNNIMHVVICEDFHDSILDEIIEINILVFMYNNQFKSDNLYKLSKLKSIVLPNSYKMAIDFSLFKELEEIDITWNNNLIFKGLDNLRYLILRKYDKETFELDLPKEIEYIQLIQGKLKSIQGIENINH